MVVVEYRVVVGDVFVAAGDGASYDDGGAWLIVEIDHNSGVVGGSSDGDGDRRMYGGN
uniref:Uncharacterized protein n=1 Tax=Solanum tuberosum TaxID=4113 RepID=M1AGH5_SOLTU